MPEIKTGRHIQDYSLELLDGTAVVTTDDRNEVLATIISRLYRGLQERWCENRANPQDQAPDLSPLPSRNLLK